MLLLPIGLMASAPIVAAGLLIDSIAATVVGAYGMRKLRAAYAGPAARVRRSSDGTEQDIGFAASSDGTARGSALDTGGLLAFCGAGSGFVSKWYDQSGAGQHLVQTTPVNQPQIVAAGIVSTLGNSTARPTLKCSTASGTSLLNGSFALAGSAVACLSVGSRSASQNSDTRMVSFQGGGGDYQGPGSAILMLFGNGGRLTTYRSGYLSGVPVGTSPFQAASVYDGANHTMTLDGAAGSAVASAGALTSPGAMRFGASGSGEYWDGAMAEHVIVAGALSAADQAVIRASQKAYYGTP